MNALLYFPSRTIVQTPATRASRSRRRVRDRRRRAPARVVDRRPRARIGHVLLCHGNAGNIGDRVAHPGCCRRRASTCCPSTTAATGAAAGGRARTAPTSTRAPPRRAAAPGRRRRLARPLPRRVARRRRRAGPGARAAASGTDPAVDLHERPRHGAACTIRCSHRHSSPTPTRACGASSAPGSAARPPRRRATRSCRSRTLRRSFEAAPANQAHARLPGRAGTTISSPTRGLPGRRRSPPGPATSLTRARRGEARTS